jgi:uncharacterized membrane protein
MTQTGSAAKNVVNNATLGFNFYSGGTVINNGTLQLGTKAALPQAQAAVAQPASPQGQEETLSRYQQKLAQPRRQWAMPQERAEPVHGMRAGAYGSASAAAVEGQPAQDRGGGASLAGKRMMLGVGTQPSSGYAQPGSTLRDDTSRSLGEHGVRSGYTISKPVYEVRPQPPATGLASLDVELPRSGEVYRFTTPRGEIEITAWAISKTLSHRLEYLVVVLTTLVVLVAGIILVRRQFWKALVGPVGSTHLIWIGLLMAVFGIFAVVGLLAAAVGVAAKVVRGIARAAARRRGRAQTA